MNNVHRIPGRRQQHRKYRNGHGRKRSDGRRHWYVDWLAGGSRESCVLPFRVRERHRPAETAGREGRPGAREIGEELLRLIPHLRRYGACLTGAQAEGDRLVETCLKSIAADGLRMVGGSIPVSLFKAFHAAQGRICPEVPCSVCRDDSDRMLLTRILELPEPQRQALVLTKTIGFTNPECARILDLSTTDVETLTMTALIRIWSASYER